MRLSFGLIRPLTINYSQESAWIESIVIEAKSRKKVFVTVNLKNGSEYTKVVRKKDVQEFLAWSDEHSIGQAVMINIWNTFKG